MKFSASTYVSGLLSAQGLKQGGGKKDHYSESQKVVNVAGLAALGGVTLHFHDESTATRAANALLAAGINVTRNNPAIPEWLTYDEKAAHAVARAKWKGQRQGFDFS